MNDVVQIEPGGGDPREASGGAYQAAVRTAIVAGVFSLVAGVVLLYDYSCRPTGNPFDDAAYVALKLIHQKQPDDENVKEAIRRVDEQLCSAYFHHRAFTAVGAWLLLSGVAVGLIAARAAVTLRRKLPSPQPQAAVKDFEARWTAIGRQAVAGLAVALIGLVAGLWFAVGSEMPQLIAELQSAASDAKPDPADENPKQPANGDDPSPANGDDPPPANGDDPSPANGDDPSPANGSVNPDPPPSPEEIEKMWHRFRGPGGLGISAYTNVPDSWDAATGKNILWKTPVPLPGMNSPVVWGNRVFLTGADENQRKVYCFDADGGKIVWEKEVAAPNSPAKPLESVDYTGYAAPTVTTDGRRVFAMFANGDLAAFDYKGNQVWALSLGLPVSCYGHAASLATCGDLLLVQLDQGATAKKGLSKLYAVDGATGETRWEVARPVPNSWTSPIVINHEGRAQVIACGDPWVISCNPEDGKEYWRASVLSGDCGPSPVYAGGLLHVGNEYCRWFAIRPDGEGDVTETDKIVWTADDGLPDTCCPVATEEFVFLMPGSSYFTCLDAKTGELLWEFEFEEDIFTSSPSLVGDRLYLFADEGRAFIMEFDRTEAREVGRSELGEECVTSPAFQDGRIYIRGKTHLFCIGESSG